MWSNWKADLLSGFDVVLLLFFCFVFNLTFIYTFVFLRSSYFFFTQNSVKNLSVKHLHAMDVVCPGNNFSTLF